MKAGDRIVFIASSHNHPAGTTGVVESIDDEVDDCVWVFVDAEREQVNPYSWSVPLQLIAELT